MGKVIRQKKGIRKRRGRVRAWAGQRRNARKGARERQTRALE